MDLKTPTTATTAINTTTTVIAPTPVSAVTATATATATTTPETETETPPTKHLSKCLSFTNGGSLKLHHHHNHHSPPLPVVVVYKECLKNHAATLGGHALDGCGEFMPSPACTPTDPTSLKCAACGCHRNFHRRDPEEQGTHLIEYHPPNTQQPVPAQAPLPNQVRSPNSLSPPPISSSYFTSSAPGMLMALSTGGLSGMPENHQNNGSGSGSGAGLSPMGMNGGGSRKRFRTKFSQEQKDKMYSFSERLGWKMQKRDEGLVEEFCSEVGVGKGVLKVWMHNNKHTFGKRDVNGALAAVPHPLLHHNTTTLITPASNNTNHNINNINTTTATTLNHHNNGGNGAHVVGNNCSSSSS